MIIITLTEIPTVYIYAMQLCIDTSIESLVQNLSLFMQQFMSSQRSCHNLYVVIAITVYIATV